MSFGSTKPPAHPQGGGVVIPETSINHTLTRLFARDIALKLNIVCNIFFKSDTVRFEVLTGVWLVSNPPGCYHCH